MKLSLSGRMTYEQLPHSMVISKVPLFGCAPESTPTAMFFSAQASLHKGRHNKNLLLANENTWSY
jgi:hypothetical protein